MIKPLLIAASTLLLAPPALAQTPDPHAGHVMPGAAATPAPPMDHSMMPGMDHSKMDMTSSAAGDNPMPGVDHSKMSHGGMAMTPAPKGITRSNVGPAEAALQAFSDALEVGNRDLAIARLAPDLKVIEDGIEENRADYIGGHLAADIEYQKSVKTVLVERSVFNDGTSQARIVSKVRMVGNRSDKMVDTTVLETAILKRVSGEWRISRLEWASAK